MATSQLAVEGLRNWDQFKLIDFKPKEIEDKDIDIRIEFCGVCGSDVHSNYGRLGEASLGESRNRRLLARSPGVGPGVTEFKVGDRVGVGAQIGACYSCDRCKGGAENYCTKGVDTYNAKYPNGDIAQGGYSTAIRANERFVFKIPDEVELEDAAPMMCAGLTVFAPLKYHGAGPGKSVGVMGIGGLGHFAIQFAQALGSDRIIAFSHSENKKNDALEMGATDFVITANKNFPEAWKDTVDIMICTIDASKHMPLTDILATLKVHGRCVMVAIPDDHLPPIHAFDLVPSGIMLAGSHIGSKADVIEMLELAANKKVKSRTEILDMSKAGEAVKNLKNNNVRYRFVLRSDI
ncbi:NADPH-dependent alcohol dehydrogenase [Coprinellus micaceus]|uniref:NADPH-dependent alcohol dehydrogenase n=1 Tax=Coprinellus micaceus TaxID=71717 RepID=A0A4Y7SQG5_COPMI|nr:NADPH-dependent alcohol dehydrogenase [Coprinellus micaceus]